jgi:glycosyltransferase involved in cell wall biosynthesis
MARFCGTEAVLRTTHSVFLFTGRIRLQTIVARWFSRSILSVHYIFIGPSVSENETTRFLNTGQVVRNYVDERIYYPPLSPIERETVRRELCIEPGTFVLLSAGSCLEVKRHADILEAVALLMSQGIQVHYIHAGSGPLEALEVHCSRSLTVADSVRFIGVQKHMRRLYLACDCLVMPSEKEGYPMAALEAAACAAPVVAYDVYGLRDVVRDQVTGLLTSPSPEALANAIADLMSRSDRAEMGVTGHSFVLEENSRSEWIKAHIRLYAPHGISATHHSR